DDAHILSPVRALKYSLRRTQPTPPLTRQHSMKHLRRDIRARLPFLLLLAALAACVSTPDSARDNERAMKDVRAVLDAQAAAWNRGDIAGYMDGYERAETTTFISGDTITRGWQTVLE